ncbi:squalene epoxidase-domain-containing protein [Catenaria anguillulae PL171]|uniref:Squalene monooxygenase n=1 Tax=Catenaria anguillulae PL171 TaxID=765915 RepID=A0A1Y2I214_9FUNG|nr:squalene epoxidase-domain-containing protein [Catenaria anguillulae PL171]
MAPRNDQSVPVYQPSHHDIVIVGAGVAGSALAYALAQDGRSVALIERDLSEPDRIVGELMQPGGCLALAQLGLGDTLDNMDAIDVHGYVVLDKDEVCHLKYPTLPETVQPTQFAGTTAMGKSFHHGRFIMNLRRKCMDHPNVTVVQATASELVRDLTEPRVVGVHAIARTKQEVETHHEFLAPLTFIADGCFSKFRPSILGTTMQAPSHFVGFILDRITLPAPNHGHVVLADPSPILLYQIGTNDTRILVDVPGSSMPSNRGGALVKYLTSHVAPQLPKDIQQRAVPGLVMLGDAHNMRHPLTGGGMSVALNDVVLLRAKLRQVKDLAAFVDTPATFAGVLRSWYWQRKRLSSVVNILANALYALFSAGADPTMNRLRRACFDYLRLGGECTAAPVRLLACIAPQPLLLVRHFFQVAAYAAWHVLKREPVYLLPRTIWRQTAIMVTAVRVIGPLCWYELRGAPRVLSGVGLEGISSAVKRDKVE